MTLDAFSVLLDRFAGASATLTGLVHTRDADGIQLASRKLADATLALQQAMPKALVQLEHCSPAIREAFKVRLEAAAQDSKIGAELSDLQAASATSRLAFLAQASGADLSYANNGQLGLGARY
jgi:hypothetical protein